MVHELLGEILKCDDIKAPEVLVFHRLMEWFQNNKKERKRYMSQLLELIRLEYITPEVRIANGCDVVNIFFKFGVYGNESFHLICNFTANHSTVFISTLIVRSSYPLSSNDGFQIHG